MNARLPSSAPASTTNKKARSSDSCKIIGMYSHENLWTCRESRENWPSKNLKCIIRRDRFDRSCVVSRLIKREAIRAELAHLVSA
jgi:hypothetical protein